MKKFFLVLVLITSVQLGWSQLLADITVTNSGRLIAIDETGHVLFEKYLGYQEKLVDFSTSIIVTQTTSGRVTVYDQTFSQISSKFFANDEKVKRVSDDYVVLVNENCRTYFLDKYLNYISK